MSRYLLTYIYHDCFTLATEDAVIVFDYWKDPKASPADKDFPPILDDIECQMKYPFSDIAAVNDSGISKKLYVLVSHHHKDHFSRRIFNWYIRFPQVHYIISRDVYKSVKYLFNKEGFYNGEKPPLENISVLSPGEEFNDDIVSIKAYGSTDIGNSYALNVSGLKIFHAGDLNAWLWIDESSASEVEEAKCKFTKIVNDIGKENPEFDLVMFPVDSRLGTDYWWGAKYWVERISSSLFVPMHYELVLSDEEKEKRRLDAGAFSLFARKDYGSYLQFGSTRSSYLHAD